MSNLSARDIKAQFRYRGGPHPVTQKFFFRPISFWFTPLFLYAGLSPNQVTAIGFLFGLLSLALFIWGMSTSLFWVAVVSLYLQKLMDHIDGNVGRATDTCSYFGKFFDGYVDKVTMNLLPFSIGLGFTLHSNEAYIMQLFSVPVWFWFAMGAGTTTLLMLRSLLTARYAFYKRRIWMDSNQPLVQTSEIPEPWVLAILRKYQIWARILQFDFIYIGVILLGVLGRMDWFLLGMVMLGGSASMIYIYLTLLQASKFLNIHKSSKHQAIFPEKPR